MAENRDTYLDNLVFKGVVSMPPSFFLCFAVSLLKARSGKSYRS